MKLKDGFITQPYHGHQLMVAVGGGETKFNGIVDANETAAFIVDCLKRETTEAEIVHALTDAYEVDEARAAAGVRGVLEKLRGIGAIEE